MPDSLDTIFENLRTTVLAAVASAWPTATILSGEAEIVQAPPVAFVRLDPGQPPRKTGDGTPVSDDWVFRFVIDSRWQDAGSTAVDSQRMAKISALHATLLANRHFGTYGFMPDVPEVMLYAGSDNADGYFEAGLVFEVSATIPRPYS